MVDLSTLPQCGVACVVSSLSSSACDPSDEACLCADQLYNSFAESCVISNCTVREGLVVKNATWTGCGFPQETHKTEAIIAGVVLLTLQVGFFGTRMLSRAMKIAPWDWDDTTLCLSFVLILSFGVAPFVFDREGLGHNIWTLTPDQIDHFFKVFYIYEVFYSFVVFMLKISIVFFYMRIFRCRTFRIVLWATQGVLIAALVVFVVVDSFPCRPISAFWRGWDGERPGHCLDLNAYAWTHAGINIALEFWLLALPATQVWGLHMPLSSRIRVVLMFGFGIFATSISIVRLNSLRVFTKTMNPTMDFLPTSVWSCTELTAGLIVACMPASRQLVIRYYPQVVSYVFSSKCSDNSTDGSARSSKNTPLAHLNSQGSTRPFNDRFKKVVAPLVLSPRDLDKNRSYSMHVSVTSAGAFSPSHSMASYSMASHSMASQHELAEDLPDLLESRASRVVHTPQRASHIPPGACLGVPERLLGDGQDLAQGRIIVTQDVSIVHSSAPQLSRNHALDEGYEDENSKRKSGKENNV